jgi:integrase
MLQLSLFDRPDFSGAAEPSAPAVALDPVPVTLIEVTAPAPITVPAPVSAPAPKVSPVASPPSTPVVTLADALAVVLADQVRPPSRIRNLASSLRTFGRGVGRGLDMIPATATGLRDAMAMATPLLAGIGAKRWSNVVADVRLVLTDLGVGPARPSGDLSAAWADLKGRLPAQTLRRRLSTFIAFCDRTRTAPADVTAETLWAFYADLEGSVRAKTPKKTAQKTAVAWNDAVTSVERWPSLTLPVPSWSRTYRLPDGVLPASFEADLARLRDRLSGADLLDDDAPDKPLRPSTLDTKLTHLKELAAAAVHGGVPAATIADLTALMQPPTLKAALSWLITRHGGESTPGLIEMGHTAVGVARRHVGPDELEVVERMVRKLGTRTPGMTPKNRQRLAAFDDERLVDALFDLPDKLDRMATAKACTLDGARLAQTALLISIWLSDPLRAKNMHLLKVDQHIVRHGTARTGETFIEVPGTQTKNEVDSAMPLPARVVARLDRYLAVWRPLLGGTGSPWLFPGRKPAKAKHPVSIADQVKKAILTHVGVPFNPHLFRHFTGKMALTLDPGNYELVRRLLGHRSINTTTMYYTGLESAAAARLYDAKVLAMRERPDPSRSGKTGRKTGGKAGRTTNRRRGS